MSPPLTPEQMLRVATAHIISHVDQHTLAALMGVNQGRINEACKAIEWAINNHVLAYKLARGKAHVEVHNGDEE